MKRLLAAVATATVIAAGGAFAQDAASMQDMHGQLTAMQETVQTELARHGIEADLSGLTLGQLSEVFLILNNESLNDQEKTEQLRTILEPA